MAKIKILEIIPTLDQSGAEKQLTLLAAGLPKDEFEVQVAVLTRDGPLSDILRQNKIRYTVIGKSSKISFSAYFKLKKIIQTFRPDIVHSWIFAANAYGRQAAIACRVPKIICGERCVDPWKKKWHFWIDQYLARKTDVIAVNSEGIKDFYIQNRLPEEKFVVIPNAVIPIASSPLTRSELLERIGISQTSDSPFLIGLVARLWPQKRIRDALWSFDQLKFAGLKFHAIIIGDGPERDNLLRYRDALLLKDCVHFPGHQKDVSLFMSHFDLFWNTSAYEGQSNSILEAMSVGVPVLASDIPGNRELVLPDKTGLLIPEFGGDLSRRRTAFTHETLEILKPENKSKRLEWGKNAIFRVQNDFSLEKMILQYINLYRGLWSTIK
ncbi:MAG: glycosyltransferase [Planctomycetia bacterium]|nr:glycosyltransferase [Planctomycetia bacterium]